MTTIQQTQAAELRDAPVGTLVTIDTGETLVRADRSEWPWLIVEDSTSPDSQTWLGHDDVAAHDVDEIVYPANYTRPAPQATIANIWHPLSSTLNGHASVVEDRTCRHVHRTVEAAGRCGLDRVKRIQRERAGR